VYAPRCVVFGRSRRRGGGGARDRASNKGERGWRALWRSFFFYGESATAPLSGIERGARAPPDQNRSPRRLACPRDVCTRHQSRPQ